MSDELDTLKGSGIGAAITAAVGVLWGVFRRQSERNADKVEADREARLIHCEKALEAHRDQLEILKRDVAVLNDRVATLQGVYRLEPITNPGLRPSPAIAALQAKYREGGDGG